MSFLDLAKYTPSGAFSIEIAKRDPVTGGKSGTALAESFFLLPPESQTVEEGYKVSVTKTINGAWIDDFGNDIKKISIQGSLWSYYFGLPNSTGNAAGTFGGQFLSTASKTITDFGQNAIAPVTGVSALDEFFKLRYIVSRFREEEKSKNSKEFSALASVFPELARLKEAISETRKPSYKDFIFIYHDYDDGNHFDVIFEKFSATRSKEDPFNVVYNIEMTGIKNTDGGLNTFGKLGRGIKETGLSIARASLETFQNSLDLFEQEASIPIQVKESFDSVISSASNHAALWQTFVDGIKNDWDSLIANSKTLKEDFQKAREEYLGFYGVSQSDLAAENVEVPEDALLVYNTLQKMDNMLTVISGFDRYGGNNTKATYFSEEDTPSIKDIDFGSETQDGGSTEASQNQEQSVDFIYYIVEANDTLAKIANKFYGDYTKAELIGQINELDNDDFFNDALLGQSIKIPLLGNPVEVGTDTNLVYVKVTPLSSAAERQTQVLGTDINLSEDREIVVDGTGDIRSVNGVDGLEANLNDRIEYPQGTLGVLHVNWGFSGSIGEIPQEIAFEKIISNLENQLNADPRVVLAYVKRSESTLEGDVLSIPTFIKTITGNETIIDPGKLVSGNFV
jgi:LysM repeat protein